MKLSPKIFLVLLCLIVLSSCRKDEYRFEEAPEEAPLVTTSLVANLMQRTALNDGSSDNIIDKASCISIKLPVSLVVNGIQITINNEDDYETIEAIFDDGSTDILVVIFPINIILEDFTEVRVISESELNSYRNNCPDENEDDDDIECIDFNYPITVTTYNTLIDELGSETINTDKEFYEFIDDIEDYLIVNINFPIELRLSDGTLLSIDDLDDLEDAIEDAIDDCDEDDDYDFDDDDDEISEIETEFIALITQCDWKIYELEINEQHMESQFDGYKFTFNADGSSTAINLSGTVYNGVWAVSLNNDLKFTIQFSDFPIISRTWTLKEINPEDEGAQIDLRYLEDELKLKHMCP